MLMELHPTDKANLCALLTDSVINTSQRKTPTLDILEGASRNKRMREFEANQMRFEVMKKELMEKYPRDAHVAVSKGMPVIVGDEFGEVADECYRIYGKEIVIYIGRLSDEQISVEMPGFVSYLN